MSRMYDGDIEPAPFVDADAETNRLSGDGQHCRIVADEDDPSGRGNRGFDDTDDVGNRKAEKQWPHGKVLEARG